MKPPRPDLENMDESDPLVYYAKHLEELVKGQKNMIALLSQQGFTLTEENNILNMCLEEMNHKLEKLLRNNPTIKKEIEEEEEEEKPKDNVVQLFRKRGHQDGNH